jgi:hypothetical protein
VCADFDPSRLDGTRSHDYDWVEVHPLSKIVTDIEHGEWNATSKRYMRRRRVLSATLPPRQHPPLCVGAQPLMVAQACAAHGAHGREEHSACSAHADAQSASQGVGDAFGMRGWVK